MRSKPFSDKFRMITFDRLFYVLILLVLTVPGEKCTFSPGTIVKSNTLKIMDKLKGSWEKIADSACSQMYPAFIEFRGSGLYSAKGTGLGNFPSWDAGTWEIISLSRIKISTNNDAVIEYNFSVKGDILTFTDPQKCRFSYRKANP
jgi:hypothetical protein